MMGEITDVELHAFVDDELDHHGRVEVLSHLLVHPQDCTRVLQDMRSREMMRSVAAPYRRLNVSPELRTLAERLQDKLAREDAPRRKRGRVALALAASLSLIVVAGLASEGSTPALAQSPVYLKEALASQRAASTRLRMVSQVETPKLDARDIQAGTRISVPRIAGDWQITDVQVFPSDYGPSIQLSIRTLAGRRFSLFATHATTGAPSVPRVTRIGSENLVAWSRAGNTYVLSGGTPAKQLLAAARDLADNEFT